MKWCDRALVVSPYCYGLCRTEAEFQQELKRLKIPRSDWPEFMATTHANATVHFFEKTGDIGRCAIVCLQSSKGFTKAQVYACLAHEAVHIWQAIRDDIGEKYPSSEFEAYSIQAITQNLILAYEEKK